MKRTWLFLSLLLVALLCCGTACADLWGSVTIDGTDYDLYKTGDWMYYLRDGAAILFRYEGEDTAITLPTELDGYAFNGVPDFLFNKNNTLREVTIPAGYTRIQAYSFRGCTALTTVHLPQTLTEVGDHAFADCSSLRAINWPSSLKQIGSCAFLGDTSLASVTLNGCTDLTIGTYAFNGCTALQGLTLGEGITGIDYAAFMDCTALERLTLPVSLTWVGEFAFCGCTALRELTYGGADLQPHPDVFYHCDALDRVTIRDGVTVIPEQLFMKRARLKTLSLPDSLESIESFAFADCQALEEVSLSAKHIGERAFADCGALRRVTLREGVESLGEAAFAGTEMSSIQLPASLRYIGLYALWTETLQEVDVPDTLTGWELPFVHYKTQMVLTRGGRLHAALLATEASNFRLRGETPIEEAGEKDMTLQEKVSAVVAQVIRPGMSDWEKALALHDYICATADYAFDELDWWDIHKNDPGATTNIFDAEGIFFDGRAVCQGYMLAYELLLDEVGIENRCEYGDDHGFNLLKLDGEWYYVDSTWDDGNDGTYHHVYFCVTYAALQTVSSHECYDYPELHGLKNYRLNYAYLYGGLDSRIAEVTETVQRRLEEGQLEFTFTPASFGTGINDVMAITAACDQTFEANGIQYAVTMDYNKENQQVTVHARAAGETLQVISLGHVVLSRQDQGRLRVPAGSVIAQWTSDTQAVTVSDSGLLRPVGTGEATITAEGTTAEGKSVQYTWTCEVTELRSATLTARVVGAEAVAGTAMERLVITARVSDLGSAALGRNGQLRVVVFQGNTPVPSDLFAGCAALTVIAPAASPAAQWAEEAGCVWLEYVD